MATHRITPEHARFRNGMELAVEMLRRLGAHVAEYDPASLDPAEREEGSSQDNAVLDYLTSAGATGSETVRGFAAVLSDYVSGCVSGTVRDIEWYEKHMRCTDGMTGSRR